MVGEYDGASVITAVGENVGIVFSFDVGSSDAGNVSSNAIEFGTAVAFRIIVFSSSVGAGDGRTTCSVVGEDEDDKVAPGDNVRVPDVLKSTGIVGDSVFAVSDSDSDGDNVRVLDVLKSIGIVGDLVFAISDSASDGGTVKANEVVVGGNVEIGELEGVSVVAGMVGWLVETTLIIGASVFTNDDGGDVRISF